MFLIHLNVLLNVHFYPPKENEINSNNKPLTNLEKEYSSASFGPYDRAGKARNVCFF